MTKYCSHLKAHHKLWRPLTCVYFIELIIATMRRNKAAQALHVLLKHRACFLSVATGDGESMQTSIS